VINDSPLAVLCALPPRRADVRAIVRRVLDSGRAWVAVASFEGQEAVRICVTNGRTALEDVDVLVDALTHACESASG
jgi:hypothetical protein